MNIQYVRLSDEVCEILNRLAQQQRRTVSDLVNEMLWEKLKEISGPASDEHSAASEKGHKGCNPI